jgi:hypothetical protein
LSKNENAPAFSITFQTSRQSYKTFSSSSLMLKKIS